MSEILEEIFEKGRSEGVAMQKAESDRALVQMGNSLSQMTSSLSQRDERIFQMTNSLLQRDAEIARLTAEVAALKSARL